MTKSICTTLPISLLCLFLALVVGTSGCSETTENSEQQKKPPLPPKVNDNRTDLILSWFEEGMPKTASTTLKVPDKFRKEVRVQDPTIAPEKRDPDWVFIADLTKQGKDKTYPVKVLLREKWELARRPEISTENGEVLKEKFANQQPVIMYATVHCPVCISARRWLVEEKIPFVEKNVDSDQNAAKELALKGQAQGVLTNGVPVFDINGYLLPGFDKTAIRKLLTTPPKIEESPPPSKEIPIPQKAPPPDSQDSLVPKAAPIKV